MPVETISVYVDATRRHRLHVYASAQPCVADRTGVFSGGGFRIAEEEEVAAFDMYMQHLELPAPRAACLSSAEYWQDGRYPCPLHHVCTGGALYEIGICQDANPGRAVFYIHNCTTRAVRLLKVVCERI